MRRLLQQLADELDGEYAALADELKIPVGFFQVLSRKLPSEAFSQWKLAGWIEALNDLVYFLDIWQQWKAEADRREFAAQLFAECQEKFFENSYLDELFPKGRPQSAGLSGALTRLCRRLAQEITQESLCLDPALAVAWRKSRHPRVWEVPGTLKHNVERAEEAKTVSVGFAGDGCEAPHEIRRALQAADGLVRFHIDAEGISVKAGNVQSLLWSVQEGEWQWPLRLTTEALRTEQGPVTIGSTLVYGKNREPRQVARTDPKQVARIRRAWETIGAAWPEGHEVLALLTSRIIPLKAKGVVSFSYRHRPGLSFINCFDRDNLDLIDDLIHENSHHHLNLFLRKHVMYYGDHNQQIFYSPWRRSLRPLRGILHASFTFTMGALLFERLSAWGERHEAAWREAGLTTRDLVRARFRCLEEIESVRYSIQDLEYAGSHLKWLTGSGARLVRQLEEQIEKAEERIAPHRTAVLRSTFGPALRRHIKELQQARQVFGPVRLGAV